MINFWKSDNVRLRAITKDDTRLFVDNNGDFDTETARRYDFIDFPLSNQQLIQKIEASEKEAVSKDDFTFVIETIEHEPAGLITTFDCDRKSGTFKYGIFLLEKFKGRGYAAQAVKIVLNYYFNELRYNKVNVYIYDYNLPSCRFHEKLGFVQEGRLRQMAYSNGTYHDTIFYGMLKEEFNSANPLPEL